MATKQERNEKEMREHRDFLRELAGVRTMGRAWWGMAARGRYSDQMRERLALTLRYGEVRTERYDEVEVHKALLARLKENGVQWEEGKGHFPIVRNRDGSIFNFDREEPYSM